MIVTPHPRPFVLVAAALALGAGCKGGCGAPPSAPPAPGGRDPVVGVAAEASAARAVTPEVVNLLYLTPAVVAVSSKVANPRDFPEHLVDGKPETAWNGRSGDLAGAWIAFRIPNDARVTSVAISAGFDHVTADGVDLFLANHRITRLRVWREGNALRDATLDPAVRTPQSIAIDAEGGDFKLEVLETMPGTKRAWREIVVSELAVHGRPGSRRRDRPALPKVYVGGLDGPVAEVVAKPALASARVAGPFASLDAFCAEHETAIAPRMAAGKDDYPGAIEGPYCVPSDRALVERPPAPFIDVRTVTVTTWDSRDERLALTTARGVYVTGVVLASEELRNPGCAGSCVTRARPPSFVDAPAGETIIVRVDEHCQSNPFPSPDADQAIAGSSRYSETSYVCRADAAAGLRCASFVVANVDTPYRAYEERFDDVKWGKRASMKVSPAGEVVFE